MEWTLELVLVVLLLATLLQAIRLERALGALKRDRASLESLVEGFNASTHLAESGIQRLRAAADGAGRQIEAQIARSASLKDDLSLLIDRGGRIADRLDGKARAATGLAPGRKALVPAQPGEPREPRPPGDYSQAERELLAALRMAR
jgi:hypothetical protein